VLYTLLFVIITIIITTDNLNNMYNSLHLALIKLKDPVDFQKYTAVSPACLDKPNSHDTTYEQANAWVAGWGLNASDATFTMGTLQKLVVKIFTPKECHGFFDERFSRRMMCAGYKAAGKDSCKVYHHLKAVTFISHINC